MAENYGTAEALPKTHPITQREPSAEGELLISYKGVLQAEATGFDAVRVPCRGSVCHTTTSEDSPSLGHRWRSETRSSQEIAEVHQASIYTWSGRCSTKRRSAITG
jgi:hypothetical protein